MIPHSTQGKPNPSHFEAGGLPSRLCQFYQVLAILVVTSLCAYSIIGVYRDHSLLSLDGAFQTYVMVSAIDRGLELGTDYFPYLGPFLGYAIYPMFKLLGGTLFASTAASYLLSSAGFALALWVIAGLVGATGYKRGIVVLGGGLLIAFSLYGTADDSSNVYAKIVHIFLATLSEPGNSLRSLRWLLPYLSAAVLLWGHARFVRAGRSLNAQRAFLALWGLVTGLQPYWSPDAGFPSMAALVFAWILFDGKSPFYPFLGRLALMISVAVATTLLTGLAMTSGNLVGWFDYLFIGLREEQFWFFGPWEAANRIFSVSDIWQHVLTGIRSSLVAPAMVLASIVALRLHRTPCQRIQRTLLIYVTFTVSGAALLPQISGHVGDDYAAPIILPFFFLLYLLTRGTVAALRNKRNVRLPSTNIASTQKPLRPLRVLIVCSPLVLMAATSADLALRAAVKPGEQTIFVSTLGANVRAAIQPEIEVMHRFAQDADNAHIPANTRTFSSYTSTVDLIAGAVPPSPYGMLIHALGTTARHRHLESFQKHDYPLVTTINPEFQMWANWNLRASWYLYREIVKRYQPFARTTQHIFWVPRDTPLPPAEPLSCSVGREAGNRQVLSVEGSSTWSNGEPLLGEITFEVKMQFTPTALPLIGGRALMTAVERQSALSENEGVAPMGGTRYTRRYGIGQRGSGLMTLVVEHDPRATSVIAVESFPADRSTLTVLSCSARAVAPALNTKTIRPLTREMRIPVAAPMK